MKTRSQKNPLVSVVCPFHNNARQIGALAGEIRSALRGYRAELICVDDGSTDDTWSETLRLVTTGNAQFRVCGIKLSRNFGQHAAILAGLENALGDYAVILDGDRQDNPAHIPAMIEKARSGFDVVHAKRRPEKSTGRRIFRSCVHRLLTWASEIVLHEAMGNYKLLSRRALDAALRFSADQPLLELMIHKIGFPTAHVEVERRSRPIDGSSYGLGKSVLFLTGLMVAYSSLIFTVFAAVGVLSCMVAAALFALSSAHLAALAILQMGITLIVGGTVGLYVRRLQLAARNWPQYVIEEKI